MQFILMLLFNWEETYKGGVTVLLPLSLAHSIDSWKTSRISKDQYEHWRITDGKGSFFLTVIAVSNGPARHCAVCKSLWPGPEARAAQRWA